MKIAALYVEDGGCYFNVKDVIPYPESSDARTYSGPWSVIAHPPCQKWGALARVNYKRWGGEHNKLGNDGGCFKSALFDVRRFGGVLEHPAYSMAWDFFNLEKPKGLGWFMTKCGGWTCEVWQSAYGHRARKKTWLYYHGSLPPFDLDWSRHPGTHQIGQPNRKVKSRAKPVLSKKEAAATPIMFRDTLIDLCRMSRL